MSVAAVPASEIPFDKETQLACIQELLAVTPVKTPAGPGLFAGLTAHLVTNGLYPLVLSKPSRKEEAPEYLDHIVGVVKPPYVFTVLSEAFKRLGLSEKGELRDWALVKYNIAYYGVDAFKCHKSYAIVRESLFLRQDFGGASKNTSVNMLSESTNKRYACLVDANEVLPASNDKALGKDYFLRIRKARPDMVERLQPKFEEYEVKGALLDSRRQTDEMQVEE